MEGRHREEPDRPTEPDAGSLASRRFPGRGQTDRTPCPFYFFAQEAVRPRRHCLSAGTRRTPAEAPRKPPAGLLAPVPCGAPANPAGRRTGPFLTVAPALPRHGRQTPLPVRLPVRHRVGELPIILPNGRATLYPQATPKLGSDYPLAGKAGRNDRYWNRYLRNGCHSKPLIHKAFSLEPVSPQKSQTGMDALAAPASYPMPMLTVPAS